MNFPLNHAKVVHAVARIIERSGGVTTLLRIAKIAYLVDRISIQTRGIPIIGGQYFSMKKGPMTSEVSDLINGKLQVEGWRQFISRRSGDEVRVVAQSDFDPLSTSDLEIIDSVVEEHRTRTTLELVDWCHKNCPEYRHVEAGKREEISIARIVRASGKDPSVTARIMNQIEADLELDAILA